MSKYDCLLENNSHQQLNLNDHVKLLIGNYRMQDTLTLNAPREDIANIS